MSNHNNSQSYSQSHLQMKKLPLSFYIKSALSFKYISNLSIIVCILSYYMNAFDIFLVFIPLVFVNFIIDIIIKIFNFDELMEGILGNIFPDKRERDKYTAEVSLFSILWHLLPLLWIMYVLQSEDIIKIFHPNFMSIFLKSALIPITYYYFGNELNIYGDINYIGYFIIYMLCLLATCNYLYDK
jgi:hypothetical protein